MARSISLALGVFLITSLTSVPLVGAAQPAIVPLVNFLLLEQAAELTALERVLAAYKNPDSKHVFVAAHRGGRENDVADDAPGNSIANISNALSKGFDQYESDIEILGDGTLVVFHDNHFNDLTNSTVENDLLDNADLEYAKSLLLTFTNGNPSNERIPTLDEFLSAGKDKIMFKFDLKSGTFGASTLKRIFDTVVANDMQEQVLIRGGSYLLTQASEGGYDTKMIMRRFDTAPSVEEVEILANQYELRAISIPNGASNEVIAAASDAGWVVEIHEPQGTPEDREAAWAAAIAQGVRQFHSFKPGLLKAFLIENGFREF